MTYPESLPSSSIVTLPSFNLPGMTDSGMNFFLFHSITDSMTNLLTDSELSSPPETPSPLDDNVVWLKEVWRRQDLGLSPRLPHQVWSNDGKSTLKRYTTPSSDSDSDSHNSDTHSDKNPESPVHPESPMHPESPTHPETPMNPESPTRSETSLTPGVPLRPDEDLSQYEPAVPNPP